MAFTRFHDDPARVAKQLQQQTDQGRWIIDVPGNGDKPCYMLDPQIIPQKWGGNLWTKSIDIQSSLLGIDRPLNRDCLAPNSKYVEGSKPIVYPVCENLTTEESRAIMPAWTARDLPQNHAYILPIDPQAHTEMNFRNNVSTRILEKDYFQRNLECGVPQNNQQYTQLPTKTSVSKKEGFMGDVGGPAASPGLISETKSVKPNTNTDISNNHVTSFRKVLNQ
jgi:hypothetical protein